MTSLLYRVIELWHRLTAIFRRRRLDRDLRAELDFHLAMREADLAVRGRVGDPAHAARRRFGNPRRVEEELREMWTFPSVESVWHDVRYALRTLRRAPLFSVVAVTTLALGIGGTTAIFSLATAASARSLPYPESDRLVQLWGTVQRDRAERRGTSYPDYRDWRGQAQAFEKMAIFDGTTATLLLPSAERVPIETVDAAYFSILGLRPALGRDFHTVDDVPGAQRVAILSDSLWRRAFGARTNVIGDRLIVDGQPVSIVGVMGAGVLGLTDQAQMWVPFAAGRPAAALEQRGNRGEVVIARLRPGVTRQAAQAELDTIARRLEQAYPDTNDKRGVEVSSLAVETFGELRPALRALLVSTTLVLLLACANVANLLLARAANRQREIAVRAAIGASGRRLARQLLTESFVLTGLGAAAGVAVAHAALRVLVATSPITLPSFVQPGIDPVAVAFAVALAAVCGLMLGLAPAAHARVGQLSDALKSTSRGTGAGARRTRSVLVMAEVALAVMLLVGASLMIRTVSNLVTIDPGFDARSVLTLRVTLPAEPQGAASDPAAARTNTRVLDRVRAVPGVAAASLASDLPLEGNSSAVFYAAEGQSAVTAENRPRAYIHRVTPDFFSVMRMRMVAGRTFAEQEVIPDTPVVIVSEGVARRFWPGQDPIGKRIKLGDVRAASPWRQIIGVVPDVRYRGLPENPTADPDLYFPMLPNVRQVAVVARTTLPPASVAGALRAAVQELSPEIPVYNVTPLEDLLARQTAQSRFMMWLMGTFAALALLLSAVGIFGVMSYLVTQRTREIGIRLALGAARATVVREIAADGARLVAAGLALGVCGAIAVRQLLATQLFGVGLVDRGAVLAVLLIVIVAIVACLVPAARASRVDPLQAVRAE